MSRVLSVPGAPPALSRLEDACFLLPGTFSTRLAAVSRPFMGQGFSTPGFLEPTLPGQVMAIYQGASIHVWTFQ